MLSRNKLMAIGLVVVALAGGYMALGHSGGDTQVKQAQSAQVKAMKVIKQDTPIVFEYSGTVRGVQEVKVQAKVAGYVVEKYCKGGDSVTAGQPLFRIDSRNYEAQLLTAQANLAKARATLNNSLLNLQRNEQLLASAAISQQVVDDQRATVEANQATVDAESANVQLAQQNLQDCVVISPITGDLSLDDVAIGTYVGAGNTPLVTVGSKDPVFVQSSMTESDYLKFVSHGGAASDIVANVDVHLILSDGAEYPYVGHISQVDRALGNNTSTLAAKVQFPNPKGVLVPGMFARLRIMGAVDKGAILVPQRAIQQLLSESFVMVVGNDGKSKAVKVELGERIGSYYIVRSGLIGDENVVVEGLTTLAEGMPLNVTEVTATEMGFSFTDSGKTAK